MTRIAVIGTSNIGALRYAVPQIQAEYPGFDITTYGLPGARFNAACVDPAGHFGPDPSDKGAGKLSSRVNGARDIDLHQFDAILVVGDTLGMPAVLYTALGYDVVDWTTRRDRPLMSEAAFLATLREAVAARVSHLRMQFAGIGPVFAALAPYPTTEVIAKGALHQQPYAGIATHPEAARIHSLYRDHLAAALLAEDITFVPQADETIDRPFLTKSEYGRGAMDFRHDGRVLDDHRHMNASFGASLFRAFALALEPNSAGRPAGAAQT